MLLHWLLLHSLHVPNAPPPESGHARSGQSPGARLTAAPAPAPPAAAPLQARVLLRVHNELVRGGVRSRARQRAHPAQCGVAGRIRILEPLAAPLPQRLPLNALTPCPQTHRASP